MSKLFVDVTQLAEWQGKLTGIPRVINELSRRFATEDKDVVLVVWDGAAGVFKDTTYETMTRQRQQAATTTAPAALPSERQLVRVAKAVIRRIPVAERQLRRAKQKLSPQTTAGALDHGVTLSADDVLVVMWGAWDDDTYQRKLTALADSKVKLVQLVYDMLPLVTPQFSGHATASLGRYASTVYPHCDLLLSISEHSKQDVTAWLTTAGLTVPRIEVFRLGDDFHFSQPTRPADPLFKDSKLKGNDYLLMVGTIEARKNHALIYYVYKLAHEQGVTLPKLVIAGRQGWLSEYVYVLMTTDPEVKHDFVVLENANDEELSWLFEHALFSVYPSFYEGWGLPVAESIAHGTPCIASSTSSIPEIAGDLITYFSPVSSNECLEKIQSLLDPEALASARSKVSRYKPTSWDESFAAVNTYIRSI